METKLRQRKLKDNRIALCPDYYKGYIKNEEGKIKLQHKFEKLEIYLAHSPQNDKQKPENKLILADSILIQRQTAHHVGKFAS